MPDPREKFVIICPQCDGEGGYPNGLDEAACHTECTRCESVGWIVDVQTLDLHAAGLLPEKVDG